MTPEKLMMHGHDWRGENLAGRLITEKYDGVRVWWTGQHLLTRSGGVVEIPPEWRACLPAHVIFEAELWAGRGNFQIASNAARFGIWDERLRLMIFDAPHAPGGWEQRLDRHRNLFCRHEFAELVEPRIAKSNNAVADAFTAIVEAGGEGLMVRRSGTPYKAGRAREILKIKKLPIALALRYERQIEKRCRAEAW
jgi:DNA ligase-1